MHVDYCAGGVEVSAEAVEAVICSHVKGEEFVYWGHDGRSWLC